MLLLISYDLTGVDRPAAYDRVKAEIEQAATDFRRPLYSQWLVVTGEDIDVWSQRLTPLLSSPDRMLIIRIEGRTNGWLPKDYWPWINEHAG